MSEQRKRFAVFAGQVDENYQRRFLTGFMRRAFADNVDVCVFSMYVKYQDTAVREQGESNIFSLMQPSAFDGVILLKDSVQTANAAQNIELMLKEKFDKPVLIIEMESDFFPSVYTDGYEAMYNLVSHMIEVHGYKDIAFLSGKKWHKHSRQRLKSFRDAMHKHGLEVREDWIIYGDYWYQSGELCADQLLSKKGGLPRAVVCANDQMAIGLCKGFTQRGIRIPEDVAVASYDSTYEGQTSPRPLTSTVIPAEEMGVHAAEYLLTAKPGDEPKPFMKVPELIIGESCGCTETTVPDFNSRRKEWGTQISEEGFFSIFNKMPENLLMQPDLEQFIGTLYSYCYQISGAKSFHLCLTNWWKYTESDAGLRLKNEGYPDKMTYAIRYSEDQKNNKASLDETFDTKLMLPELEAEREKPTAYIFTPVFYENECFGYAAVSYGDEPRSYDEVFRRWLSTVTISLEALRRNMLITSLTEQMKSFKRNKFAGANAAYEMMSEEDKLDHDLVGQILDNNLLHYLFQPIVRSKDGSIYAYEALMRSNTERNITPLSIIKFATMQGRLEDVERATFVNVLEIVHKNRQRLGDAKVFINSIPGVRLNDTDNAKVESYLKIHSDAVVVELTEEAELSDAELERLKDYLRNLNIEIAVDDYGTGYSNISNLLRYMPNYVKIDRALLSGIQSDGHKQHFVREIIGFCHDNSILALAEGVETADELSTVIHLGADLIQGFYTGRPATLFMGQIDDKIRKEICGYYKEYLDGTSRKAYIAGKTNRISLGGLSRDRFTEIIVGQGNMLYKDISIIGAPSLKTDIHINVEKGYSGRIILENAYFSNSKNRPCIDIGEDSDVTIVLIGENILANSGICVPESSRLVIEGEGDLRIGPNANSYYGIGNELSERHGEIVFDQDGTVEVHSRGKTGVCIGSGLGGTIKINRGHYMLRSSGDMCVGLGAAYGDTKLDIFKCHIEEELYVTEGIGIGSYDHDADITITRSAFRLDINGSEIVGMGTLKGNKAAVSIVESSGELNMRADRSTCLGAMNGTSDISANFASIMLFNAGKEAIAFGGYNINTDIKLSNVDTSVEIHNSIARDTYALEERISIINGRRKFLVNNTEIERELIYDFDTKPSQDDS